MHRDDLAGWYKEAEDMAQSTERVKQWVKYELWKYIVILTISSILVAKLFGVE